MDQTAFIAAIERLGGEAYVPGIVHAASRWGIDTPQRQVHWLPQMAHESEGFVYLRELWGPTPQQRRYERNFHSPWPSSLAEAKQRKFEVNRLAYTLGNVNAGDGFRFRGRGFIQVTGRENYTRCSLALYGDERLVYHPELLELDPATSAGWYWHERGINRYADADSLEKVTRAINGGLTGLKDRAKRLAIAKDVMAEALHAAATATH
jgi:putative chitinase